MFMRFTMFNMGAGQRDIAEDVARQVNAFIKPIAGFKGITFFMDEAKGDYGAISFWETAALADAGGDIINPKVAELVGQYLSAPPERRLFEVYDPEA